MTQNITAIKTTSTPIPNCITATAKSDCLSGHVKVADAVVMLQVFAQFCSTHNRPILGEQLYWPP